MASKPIVCATDWSASAASCFGVELQVGCWGLAIFNATIFKPETASKFSAPLGKRVQFTNAFQNLYILHMNLSQRHFCNMTFWKIIWLFINNQHDCWRTASWNVTNLGAARLGLTCLLGGACQRRGNRLPTCPTPEDILLQLPHLRSLMPSMQGAVRSEACLVTACTPGCNISDESKFQNCGNSPSACKTQCQM